MTSTPERWRSYVTRGFALPTAIFLVVVLALVAAAIISISVLQNSSTSLDVLGARAYQAARAGAEWGAYQSLIDNNCAAGPTSITLAGTLTSYTTNVTCTRTIHTEGAATVNIDTITATACNQSPCPASSPAGDYVERQVTITIAQP